jgi:hypothetical protein
MSEETNSVIAVGTGSIAGGVAAVASVLGAAAPTTVALSGPALTSGLAAVGGVLGGGMLAGITVVAAAPVVGGVIGYGIYRTLIKHT